MEIGDERAAVVDCSSADQVVVFDVFGVLVWQVDHQIDLTSLDEARSGWEVLVTPFRAKYTRLTRWLTRGL